MIDHQIELIAGLLDRMMHFEQTLWAGVRHSRHVATVRRIDLFARLTQERDILDHHLARNTKLLAQRRT